MSIKATSNSSQPMTPSETAALTQQLLLLADWLEVAKLTAYMPEPRCEHWEAVVREAAHVLTFAHAVVREFDSDQDDKYALRLSLTIAKLKASLAP